MPCLYCTQRHHLCIFTLLLLAEFDGLFISNGPGDPQLCQATINNLKKVVCVEHPKPLFGICLGHQLLSLVIGSKTYKMKSVQLWGVIEVMLSVRMKPLFPSHFLSGTILLIKNKTIKNQNIKVNCLLNDIICSCSWINCLHSWFISFVTPSWHFIVWIMKQSLVKIRPSNGRNHIGWWIFRMRLNYALSDPSQGRSAEAV